jgi:hypothetical protein
MHHRGGRERVDHPPALRAALILCIVTFAAA